MPPTNLMPAFQLLSIGATIAIQHGRDARASAPLTASKREGFSPFMGLIWTH